MDYAIGIIIGFIAFMFMVFGSDTIVIIHGTKDSFQTVEWHDKNYKLVPIDSPKMLGK